MNDDLQRFIDELRARVSIADVVGAKVKLTKKGREYQGLCPFHNEKTPSFTINESKGFYHCFGCGAHGDIIKFEMNANGLPFMDALQKLAHQANLQMPHLSPKDKKDEEERKSLYDIMESACTFFERELRMPDGATGLKYFMEKRSLSKETIKKFRLGFAPGNNALMTHLKAQGIEEKDMKELGLIAIPEDISRHPHDFFRNRVMIPITNKQGRIIAFGGRVMEKLEPKYLNSPDTPIFNKRRNLYNLDKAREIAYKEKKLIICEGYMDVIALDRYGFSYAVAPLGTALTEEQITEAWKVCPEPILCLDGDTPGVKAAMRAVDRILPMLKAGYSLKFLFLPDNQDPDEYLQAHGHDSFAALLEETAPLIDILWRKYTENEDSSTPEKKALIEKTLLSEVAKIGDATVRSYYAQEIRGRIYKAFKQTPWQKDNSHPAYNTPRRPYTTAPHPYAPRLEAPHHSTPVQTPPAYLDKIPLQQDAMPATISSIPPENKNNITSTLPQNITPNRPNALHRDRETDRQGHNGNFRYPDNNRHSWNNNYGSSRRSNRHQPLRHIFTVTTPEELYHSATTENDKNLRFIIAAMFVYPELIGDYEEQMCTIDATDKKLLQLYTTMADIYDNTAPHLSAKTLHDEIASRPESNTLKNLWELDMLQKDKPFITDLRKSVEKLLQENRLHALEEEIKAITAELCQNFTEETYLRQTALKKERDQIIASAETE